MHPVHLSGHALENLPKLSSTQNSTAEALKILKEGKTCSKLLSILVCFQRSSIISLFSVVLKLLTFGYSGAKVFADLPLYVLPAYPVGGFACPNRTNTDAQAHSTVWTTTPA